MTVVQYNDHSGYFAVQCTKSEFVRLKLQNNLEVTIYAGVMSFIGAQNHRYYSGLTINSHIEIRRPEGEEDILELRGTVKIVVDEHDDRWMKQYYSGDLNPNVLPDISPIQISPLNEFRKGKPKAGRRRTPIDDDPSYP